MKLIPLCALAFLCGSACAEATNEVANAQVEVPSLEDEDVFRVETVPTKIVQCVIEIDHHEILTAGSKENILQTQDDRDLTLFDNRLELLTGFDLRSLPGEQDDGSEFGSSRVLVPSYADCKTSIAFVKHLAERHVSGRFAEQPKTLKPAVYLSLARKYGLEVERDAFQPFP